MLVESYPLLTRNPFGNVLFCREKLVPNDWKVCDGNLTTAHNGAFYVRVLKRRGGGGFSTLNWIRSRSMFWRIWTEPSRTPYMSPLGHYTSAFFWPTGEVERGGSFIIEMSKGGNSHEAYFLCAVNPSQDTEVNGPVKKVPDRHP